MFVQNVHKDSEGDKKSIKENCKILAAKIKIIYVKEQEDLQKRLSGKSHICFVVIFVIYRRFSI